MIKPMIKTELKSKQILKKAERKLSFSNTQQVLSCVSLCVCFCERDCVCKYEHCLYAYRYTNCVFAREDPHTLYIYIYLHSFI